MADERLRPPGAHVWQIFKKQAPTVLDSVLQPVVVGQLYQIKTDEVAGAGVYQYTGDAMEYSYPNLTFSSDVIDSTVAVSIKNTGGTFPQPKSVTKVSGSFGSTPVSADAFVDTNETFVTDGVVANDYLYIFNDTNTQYASGITGEISVDVTHFEDANATFQTSGVAVGQFIFISNKADADYGYHEIAAVDSETSLQVVAGASFSAVRAGANLGYSVVSKPNNNGYYKITATPTVETELAITPALPGGIMAAPGLDYIVVSMGFRHYKASTNHQTFMMTPGLTDAGDVVVSYKAVVNENKDDFMQVSSFQDLENYVPFDEIVPENQLAYALALMLAAAAPDLQLRALVVADDEIVDHTAAIDFLSRRDDVYAIAPLTHKVEIQSLYATHVEEASAPEEDKERVVIINHRLIDKDHVTEMSFTNGSIVDYDTNGIYNDFQDTTVDFSSFNVAIGNYIYIPEGDYAGQYKITAIKTANVLELDRGFDGPVNGLQYEIVSDFFTRQEIAENVQLRSMAFGSDRVVAVWPPYLELVHEDAVIQVPGYFACAVIAAMTGSFAPQIPFSNRVVGGFSGITWSNSHFTAAELDQMAAGGTWILIQRSENAPIETRHQLTTDVTSIEHREYNIRKNLDYIAKVTRNALNPYTGKYVIDDNYLEMVKSIINAVIAKLKRDGNLREDSMLLSVQESQLRSDGVVVEMQVHPPRPANDISVYAFIV